MQRPKNIKNPFFAYGIFRPGQLGFLQIKDLVSEILDPNEIAGSLLLRDGLPIIDPNGHGSVKGALLCLRPQSPTRKHMTGYHPLNPIRLQKALPESSV